MSDVQALIDRLRLAAHPEGGHFRELYRSTTQVQPADDRSPRASLTTIYFLLTAGQIGRWHRVRSDEVWHFYEGEPLELLVADPGVTHVDRLILGPRATGGQLVHVVPANYWQAARPLGTYGLAGCTVAPGFEFADFLFLRDDPAPLATLRANDPSLAELA